jgi:mannose-1-phosphate guanylyltransferase
MTLERVTVTIDSDLLKRIDFFTESGRAKSRSHAVELLLERGLAENSVRKALMLAGGDARNSHSREGRVLKPLVKLGGKTLVSRLLEQFKEEGVSETVIAVGKGGEQLVGSVKDGREMGMSVDYVWENAPVGSAGAILLAEDKLREPFFLSMGDVFLPELDLQDLAEFHHAGKALCTLVLVNVKEPRPFGVAKLTGNRIVEFFEKPVKTESNLVHAGVSVCEPEVAKMVKKMPSSFERDLLPVLAQTGQLAAYIYSGKWVEVK